MFNPPANILDLFRLDGKVALVTGSASGLGAAIAVGLAQAGAIVACHGNRRPASETAAAIGENAVAFRADLSSTTGAEDLFTQVKEKFGRVDILVNNAGTILRAAAEEVTLEDWEQVLQVNLTSVFQLSQLAARDMIPRGGAGMSCGKIVERIPAARWGQPEDLAGAALYLSCAASNYVTGTILTVDGGWMGR